MKNGTQNILNYIIFLIGLILIVGGILTGKYGAFIIGLIVAAVNCQQMIKYKKKQQ
jgi:hypothetical protein